MIRLESAISHWQMMVGILMSFIDAETTWRHHTVGSYHDATFVIAVAGTAEVVDSAIVICGHIGLGSILTILADSAGTFTFAFTLDIWTVKRPRRD
jgi:hypothetical protein